LLRVLLEVVLPFLAPFLVFYAYRLLVTRGQGFLERTPWSVLIACGVALACLSLISLAFTGGFAPGGEYVPPHLEGGRVVPGVVRPRGGGDG
jgi:hypothetical protein